MNECKTCSKEYNVNPSYAALIANVGVEGHHFDYCIECLKKDDSYLEYCSKVFYETGIDICVY